MTKLTRPALSFLGRPLLARLAAPLSLALAHGAAQAQSADPAGSGPINNALLWLQGTLLARSPPPWR